MAHVCQEVALGTTGRFGSFLESNVDWALSRERYWGTPLNVWVCECGNQESVGSFAELSAKPKAKGRDRSQPLPGDSATVTAWRQRMGTDEAKAIYRQRASTIECVNAQARNRGLVRLLVRGLAKVRAVALWFAIAHNLACGTRLRAAAGLVG